MNRDTASEKSDVRANTLRIGWASRDITPERPVMLHGQHYVRISEGVADPLTVTALALEQASTQVIMISCDLCYIPSAIQQAVRTGIGQRIPSFDPRQLFMNATHTHTGPVLEENCYTPPACVEAMLPTEYTSFLIGRIVQAAEEAWTQRKPGLISWAFSHAIVGHNRRTVYSDGSVRMYGSTDHQDFNSFEGGEDHGVNLLFTWDTDRNVTGVIVNLACPSQVSEHLKSISADYWHDVRQELRRRYGQNLYVLAQCAPAGDVSPHLLLSKNLESVMRQRSGRTERQEIAFRIAQAVDLVFEGARNDTHAAPILMHDIQTVELPVRRVTKAEYEKSKQDLAALEKCDAQQRASFGRLAENIHKRVIQRYETEKDERTIPVEIHVVRVGEIAFATNPFELFVDYSLRIKAQSKALQCFLVQLAAPISSASHMYLATEKAVNARSSHPLAQGNVVTANYSASIGSTTVGPEGGQRLVEATVTGVNALWREC